MSTKGFKGLNQLSKDELVAKIRESEKEFFDVRLSKITGQLKDTAKLWRLRKRLAQLKMLLTQSVLGAKR